MKLDRRGLIRGLGLFGAGWLTGDQGDSLRSTARSTVRSLRKGFSQAYDIDPRRAPATASEASQSAPSGFEAPPIETVRVGLIGAGGRGTTLGRLLARIEGLNSLLSVICVRPNSTSSKGG